MTGEVINFIKPFSLLTRLPILTFKQILSISICFQYSFTYVFVLVILWLLGLHTSLIVSVCQATASLLLIVILLIFYIVHIQFKQIHCWIGLVFSMLFSTFNAYLGCKIREREVDPEAIPYSFSIGPSSSLKWPV